MEKAETFRKQSEFQTHIEIIQAAYVKNEGWPADWLSVHWPHIVNPDKEYLNLPPVVGQTVRNWEGCHSCSFPWHHWHGIRSSRNLHSSQVLGLTLLGSFVGNRLDLMGQALLSAGLLEPGEVVHECDFEYKPRDIFHEPVRTNVDCMLLVGNPGEVASPIYCEVKFLEVNFGRCSKRSRRLCNGFPQATISEVANQCPLTKQGIRYWDLLPEIIDQSTLRLGCPIQGPWYQLARNLLHLVREGGRGFIVLSDARASYIDEEVVRFIEFLAPRYRQLVHRIKFQQLAPYVGKVSRSIAVLLAEKYGIG